MLRVTRCEFVHNLPCEQVSNRLTELEAENAKLRELCHDLDASRRDVIAMYRQSEESYIWESSSEIAADSDRLDKECEKLLNQFNARLYELGVQA